MLGVLIGGIVTLTAADMTLDAQEKATAAGIRHGEEVELRKTRTEAYLGYLDSTYGEAEATLMLASCMGSQPSKEPIDKIPGCRKEGLGILEATRNKDKLQDRIYIYGSLKSIEASRELARALADWRGAVVLGEPYEDKQSAFYGARDRFLLVICADVNIGVDGNC